MRLSNSHVLQGLLRGPSFLGLALAMTPPAAAQDQALYNQTRELTELGKQQLIYGDKQRDRYPGDACLAYTEADEHFGNAIVQFKAFVLTYPNGPQDQMASGLAQLVGAQNAAKAKAKESCGRITDAADTAVAVVPKPGIPISDEEAKQYISLRRIKNTILEAEELESSGDDTIGSYEISELSAIEYFGKSLFIYNKYLRTGIEEAKASAERKGSNTEISIISAANAYIENRFAGLKAKLNAACDEAASELTSGDEQMPQPCLDFHNKLEVYDGKYVKDRLTEANTLTQGFYELEKQAVALSDLPGGSLEKLQDGVFNPSPALQLYRKAIDLIRPAIPKLQAASVQFFLLPSGSKLPSEWTSFSIIGNIPNELRERAANSFVNLCQDWDQWALKQPKKLQRPIECANERIPIWRPEAD